MPISAWPPCRSVPTGWWRRMPRRPRMRTRPSTCSARPSAISPTCSRRCRHWRRRRGRNLSPPALLTFRFDGGRQALVPTIAKTRVSEGTPFPLGATWDGLGVNFALFSAHATKVELCLFDDDGKAGTPAHRTAGIHRRGLARLPARRAARHRLRLPRARPLRAGGRPPLQPQQAAARPLRQGAGRRRCNGTRRCSATRWKAATT